MRRALAVALATVAATLMIPSPAHAEDGRYSIRSCEAYDGTGPDVIRRKETCAQVRWRNQADGDGGVVLEFLDVDTVDGCSLLGGGSDAYHKVEADWWHTPTANSYGSWAWGDEPCNFNKDHNSIRGIDVGAMDYFLNLCGGDDMLVFRWRLHNGGNAELINKDHTSNHPSC